MEETIILNLKVDQAAAQKSLEQTEKNILDLKEAQSELSKEYKAGTISQTQYIRENLKLQNSIKKEQSQKNTLVKTIETESNSRNSLRLQISKLTKEYDNLNTETTEGAKRAEQLENELADLSAQLTKGNKAAGLFKNEIGNYPQQFGEAAKSINVAGLSIEGITSQFSSFLSPATAAVGVIGAIGAAYANSAVGARDLAKAQNLVSAAISVVSNDLGRLVSPNSDEGILTQVVKGYGDYFKSIVNISSYGLLNSYLDGVEERTKRIADAQERLNDLTISRAFAQGSAKDDERRAEILRRIRDDEEKGLQERIAASEQIDKILENSGRRSVIVIQAQIDAIKQSVEGYELNREAQLEVAQLTAEIADKEEEITGKLTENVTARKNIVKAQQDLVNETLKATKFTAGEPGTSPSFSDDPTSEVPAIPLPTDEQLDAAEQQIKIAEDASNESLIRRRDAHEQYLEFVKNADDNYTKYLVEQEQQRLQIISGSIGVIQSLFKEGSDEFKVLATGQAIVNTYSAATAALAPPPLGAGPILGPAFAALAIATGLANVAKINGVEFAEGGYTGQGAKYDVAGIVHKGEYVTPKKVVESPAAQPHLAALERMRNGYSDGGYVINRQTESSNQALMMANALKNLPAPVVGVREITRVQNNVKVRERATKI